ncbi:c-type cytochrome [Croceibacter atlanticus]|uniref:c-type cytochrome n=2 Tax=Croceibacter atlanticus TaxID=313588 RepID=UPI001C5D8827|nr:cytochrome c [Croceibacter atlanticus]MBW4970417.1 cytochrome c [Croceibacter atlanticus]
MNTKQMKSIFNIVLILGILISLTSCFDKEKPNYQYMDNMYEPVGYEAYGAYNVFENEQEAKLPAEGTVPRGWAPYDYEDSAEGKANAKANLKNPIAYSDDNLSSGKQLYTIYCAICHGDKGDGKGTLAKREKILGIPSYNDQGRAITEGDVYHVMYYGLNTMGSYAAQTSEEERWQIAHHVMKLKDALDGKPERQTVNDDSQVENTATNETSMTTEVSVMETENELNEEQE